MNPLDELCRRDRPLALVRSRLGDPPVWNRSANFDTFARIILEQQVSLMAAKSVLTRVRAACGGRLTAARIAALSDERLRACGCSRQKSRYLLTLAEDVIDGRFKIAQLNQLDDDAVRSAITSRLGLGPWSADVYLMMALQRPDVLPVGDLGLILGMRELDGGEYPDAASILRRTESWRPFRTTATRLVWALYLDNRSMVVPE